jgi:hypothetical protein
LIGGYDSRYLTFVDLTKAFDWVLRQAVYWSWRSREIIEKLAWIIALMY